MITFNEFLEQFDEEVQEVFSSCDLSSNARIAVVETVKKHLNNRKFDPAELLSFFESVCYSAMLRGHVNRKGIVNRVRQESRTFLTPESRYSFFPENEEFEERRSNRR